MIKRLLISPPFGNYINLPFATSVKGSYTWERRPGLGSQILKTLRPLSGGYVNRIGLRNKGIQSVSFNPNHVYSIVGMTSEEWDFLIDYMPTHLKLEVNAGCPNSWKNCISDRHIQRLIERFAYISLKLPPTISMIDIGRFMDLGVQNVHLCNTLPTSRGGESGTRLKQVVLPLISEVRSAFPNLKITAGGGIYSFQDALDYMEGGATSLSLSTVWFNPIRGLYLAKKINKLFNRLGTSL